MMGCGNSKAGSIKKSKASGKKDKNKNAESFPKDENRMVNTIVEESIEDKTDLDYENSEIGNLQNSDSLIKTISLKSSSSTSPQTFNTSISNSLLNQSELSESQQDFFKMLDEKIANGPDYNENSERTNRNQESSSLAFAKNCNYSKKITATAAIAAASAAAAYTTNKYSIPDINRNKKSISDQKQAEVTKEAVCESFDVLPSSQYHYQMNTSNVAFKNISSNQNFYSDRNYHHPYSVSSTIPSSASPSSSSSSSAIRYNNSSNRQSYPNHQISANQSPKHYNQIYSYQQQYSPQPTQLQQQQQHQHILKQTLSPKHQSYNLANQHHHQQQHEHFQQQIQQQRPMYQTSYEFQTKLNRDQQMFLMQQQQQQQQQHKQQARHQNQQQSSSSSSLGPLMTIELNPMQLPNKYEH